MASQNSIHPCPHDATSYRHRLAAQLTGTTQLEETLAALREIAVLVDGPQALYFTLQLFQRQLTTCLDTLMTEQAHLLAQIPD